MKQDKLALAGRLAHSFIDSKLTPLIVAASILLGIGAVLIWLAIGFREAVIVGASVILFEPIFQGLAISLMAGEVASLLLSRMTVPILYYLSERRNRF